MALKRPDWLEEALKTKNIHGNPQQMTVVPGLLGGARRMTYTGAGADGRVQADNPVMVDQTSYHEGELVIPEPSVKKMGGPNRAMMKIRQMEMKKLQEQPGTTGMQEGGVVLTDKQKLQQGLLTSKQLIQNAPPPSVSGIQPPIEPASPDLTQKQQLQAGLITQKQIIQNAPPPSITSPAPAATTTPDAGLNQKQINMGITTYKPPVAPEAPPANLTKKQQIMGVTEPTPAAKLALTPEQLYTRNALTQKYGRALTATELQEIVNSNPTDLEQKLLSAGLKTKDQQETADAANQNQNTQYVNDALNQMRGFANGTSDVYQRQANAAFQALDARLQTNLISTAMRIANQPNLTDGARRTMMAEEMRNAGIAQSSLAGTLADQVMSTAMQVTGQVYSMATGERAFQVQQQQDAMNTALAAGDFDAYAKLSKSLYGVDVDVSKLKNSASLKDIADGNTFIYTAISTDANTSMATNGVRTALQKIWDAQNPGKPMDESWATSTLATMKQTSGQAYQYMQGIDGDAALGLFGGDQSRVDNFSYGQYKGLEAVQHAMYGFVTGGAFTVDDKGYMDFNEDNPMYQEMCKTFGWTAGKTVTNTLTNADGSTVTTYSDGSTDTKDASGNVISTLATGGAATDVPATTKNLSTLNAAATTAAGIAGQTKTGTAMPTKIGETGLGYNKAGVMYDMSGGTPKESVSDDQNKLTRVSDTEAVDAVNGLPYKISSDGSVTRLSYGEYQSKVGSNIDPAVVLEMVKHGDDPSATSFVKARTAAGDFSYISKLPEGFDTSEITDGIPAYATINDTEASLDTVGSVYKSTDGNLVKVTASTHLYHVWRDGNWVLRDTKDNVAHQRFNGITGNTYAGNQVTLTDMHGNTLSDTITKIG